MNVLKTLILSPIFIILLIKPQVISAENTSTDTQPGQVKVTSKDGTVYLSTSVNPAEPKATPTPQVTQASKSTTNKSASLSGEPITQPAGFADNLGSYINSVLSLVIIVSLLLTFLYFILGGIQWITSGGDRGKTEEARGKIIHAVIGIIIVSSAYALVTFVAYVLGFSSLNDALTNITRINPA